ncbi:MAG: GtrA family protein [Nitrospiraceae bacterium]|nr:GtrA family protein [Nitrospiraceae bacterium]
MHRLTKEIKRFLVVGSLAVGTDWGTYYLLLNVTSHSPAKAVSFVCGTVVSYFLNKHWTFEQKRRSLAEAVRFAAVYATTLGANVLVNKLCLLLLPGAVFFAVLAATGTSTVLNFIGMKWLVFRRSALSYE